MVIGVFGLPGMGKTTFLTKCARKALNGKSFMGIKPHSKVFTNFASPGCYKLDFNKVLEYHIAKRADVTVVCTTLDNPAEVDFACALAAKLPLAQRPATSRLEISFVTSARYGIS